MADQQPINATPPEPVDDDILIIEDVPVPEPEVLVVEDAPEVTGFAPEITGGVEGRQIRMVTPGGSTTYASPDEVGGYEQLGWYVEDPLTEQALAKSFRRGREREFGGVGRQIQTAAQGVARGLSFGASDLILDAVGQGDVLEVLREVNPGAAVAGEIGGAVIGALASGGTGAARGVGRIASYTPRGAMAARAGRWISRASSGAERVARTAIAEGLEGGADLALGQITRDLVADREIDGSEVGSQFLQGALLSTSGAVAGEVLSAGSRAMRRALGLDVPEGTVGKAAGKSETDVPLAPTTVAEDIEIAALRGPNGPRRAWRSAQELDDLVRTSAARRASSEVDDLLSHPGFKQAVAEEEREQVEQFLRQQARELDEASAAAEAWRRKETAAAGPVRSPDEYVESVRKVPPAISEDGAKILAKLDESQEGFDAALAAVRQRSDEALGAAAEGAPTPAIGILDRLKTLRTRLQESQIGQIAGTVAAGAEAAQLAGVDVPSVSSVLGGGTLGKAVGLLVSAKSIGGAARSVGMVVPGVGKAVQIVQAARKYQAGVRRAINQGLIAAEKAAPRVLPKVATAPARVPTQALVDARTQVVRETQDMPVSIQDAATAQVDRAESYLIAHQPTPPDPGSPWSADWSPDPMTQAVWDRRFQAVTDPTYALSRCLSDPASTLEIEALREVYPDIYVGVQNRLRTLTLADMDRMRPEMRHALSRGFNVALLPQYLPGYLTATPAPDLPRPNPTFARPSTATASPLVRSEETRAPGSRARGGFRR
jgi:hypothetical protein